MDRLILPKFSTFLLKSFFIQLCQLCAGFCISNLRLRLCLTVCNLLDACWTGRPPEILWNSLYLFCILVQTSSREANKRGCCLFFLIEVLLLASKQTRIVNTGRKTTGALSEKKNLKSCLKSSPNVGRLTSESYAAADVAIC